MPARYVLGQGWVDDPDAPEITPENLLVHANDPRDRDEVWKSWLQSIRSD